MKYLVATAGILLVLLDSEALAQMPRGWAQVRTQKTSKWVCREVLCFDTRSITVTLNR